MGKINKLHNKFNETIYPVSISHAIYIDDTTTLHEEISNIKTEIKDTEVNLEERIEDLISDVEENKAELEAEIDSLRNDVTESDNLIKDKISELELDIDNLINNKFDNVELNSNGSLDFYANNKIIKSIKLPSKMTRAICGEFLSGELPVGYNVGSTYSDFNVDLDNPTIWIDNETPVNAFNMNSIENKILYLKKLINAKASGYYVGTTPPQDESVLWIDTSEDEVDNALSGSLIEELMSTIKSMQDKINKLEEEVEYLKINGGGGTVVPPTTEDGSYIITEDGDLIVTEDDENLILEEG